MPTILETIAAALPNRRVKGPVMPLIWTGSGAPSTLGLLEDVIDFATNAPKTNWTPLNVITEEGVRYQPTQETDEGRQSDTLTEPVDAGATLSQTHVFTFSMLNVGIEDLVQVGIMRRMTAIPAVTTGTTNVAQRSALGGFATTLNPRHVVMLQESTLEERTVGSTKHGRLSLMYGGNVVFTNPQEIPMSRRDHRVLGITATFRNFTIDGERVPFKIWGED